MKITLNLSPNEIFKLGKLTNADFANGWCTLCHTHDDVAFAIHRLINMIDSVEPNDDCDYDDYDNNDGDNPIYH
jgi:hypothetical protein